MSTSNPQAQLLTEAAAWCARLDAGPLSAEDELALRGWLADDPQRRAAFDSMSRTLADPALTAAMRRIDIAGAHPRRHADDAPSLSTREIQGDREIEETPTAAVKAIPTRNRWLRANQLIYAGATAALLCIVWLARPWVDLAIAPELVMSAAPGEVLDTVLADGSRVEVSGGTSLTVRLTATRRVVEMERGESFFTVAPDANRPFIVIADGGRVQVLGTAFNLGSTREGLQLAVHHGRVSFGPDALFASAVDVVAGEQAELRDGAAIEIETFDPGAGDWRSGWLQTDGITLAALAERLTRQFGIPVSVDPTLADKLVAGRFRLDDPEKLLRLLSSVHGFAVRRVDPGLQVVRR